MKPTLTAQPRQRLAAFTLLEMLLVILGMVILLALFLPALAQARKKSSRINCVNNLKQVGLAFRIWAGDNGDRFPMAVSITNGGTMEVATRGQVFPHFQVMSNELNTPKVLVCPQDTERVAATNFVEDLSDQKVSYFVGVDASEGVVTSLLTGDRKLMIGSAALNHGLAALPTNAAIAWAKRVHAKTEPPDLGNIGMADGSVFQFNSAELRRALANTGVATNRLAIP